MMYAVDMLSITKKNQERRPSKLSETEYRSKTNHELLQDIGDNILKRIKQQSAK